jgi:hypothetical protein
MPNVPLPPDTPEFRKKQRKKMKPEEMPMSDAMQNYLRDKTDAERRMRMEEEMADEAKEAYPIRGYAKGGMVRGCGKAVKGRGKGKMY